LEAIKYIDKVVSFDTRQELEDLIKSHNPDVLVVGSDWKGKEVVGDIFAKEVKFFDRIGDYSTTKILENNK
jgi:bifunctional ADP-heptose synthase (sugar kinase/adenylyltransferase)